MRKTQLSKGERRGPKPVLRLPDLEQAKSAVLNSLSSIDVQRGYRHAIGEFVEWYGSEPRLSFSKTVVLRYRIHLESRQLAPGTINLRLGAVRRLAYEASDCGLLSPDLAGIRRVKGVKKIGVRLGNWLTSEQSQLLWNAPDAQVLKGKRDRAILAVLLACGLQFQFLSPRIESIHGSRGSFPGGAVKQSSNSKMASCGSRFRPDFLVSTLQGQRF